jgi:hypothetical protein
LLACHIRLNHYATACTLKQLYEFRNWMCHVGPYTDFLVNTVAVLLAVSGVNSVNFMLKVLYFQKYLSKITQLPRICQ